MLRDITIDLNLNRESVRKIYDKKVSKFLSSNDEQIHTNNKMYANVKKRIDFCIHLVYNMYEYVKKKVML